MTHRLCRRWWGLVIVALVAGCAGMPAGSASPAGGSVSTIVPSASPSPSSESAAPSDGGDTTVRPGEAWIASQRLVDLDASDVTGIYLVRPDGTGSHRLVADLDGKQMHPAWSPDGEKVTFIQENPDGSKELWVVGAAGTNALATRLQ